MFFFGMKFFAALQRPKPELFTKNDPFGSQVLSLAQTGLSQGFERIWWLSARNTPFPQLLMTPTRWGSLHAKDFSQVSVTRRWHEAAGPRTSICPRGPRFDSSDQARPQWRRRIRDPHHKPPRVLDDLRAHFQDKQLETRQVPATTDRVLKLIAADRRQVERQQGQQHRRFVLLEAPVR